MLLGKLSFFCDVVSRKRSADQRKQLCNGVFHVGAGRPAKNWLDPAEDKGRPDSYYMPFLHESLQLKIYIMSDIWNFSQNHT